MCLRGRLYVKFLRTRKGALWVSVSEPPLVYLCLPAARRRGVGSARRPRLVEAVAVEVVPIAVAAQLADRLPGRRGPRRGRPRRRSRPGRHRSARLLVADRLDEDRAPITPEPPLLGGSLLQQEVW